MKKIGFLLLSIFLVLCQVLPLHAQKKKITLEDIYLKNSFAVARVAGFSPMKDERFYTAISSEKIDGKSYTVIGKYEVLTRQKVADLCVLPTSFQDGSTLNIEDYEWSEDESKLLLKTNGQNIYRRSVLYFVYVYDIATKTLQPVGTEQILHASFNADASKVAFVQDNNLLVYDVTSHQIQAITTDGKWNFIINGNCDWVYEEEFSFTKAFEWSPDGQHIAYYRFDESKVKEYSMTVYEGLYPKQYEYKYPKAGEDNSIVSIHVYNLNTLNRKTVDIGSNTDQYIPRIKWANDKELCVLRLNRLQNKLDYLFYDIATQQTNNELTDENNFYVDIVDPLMFFDKGKKMLFQSERDGFNHVYLLDRNKQKVKQITKGNFDVDGLIGFNPKSAEIFFTAGVQSPLERQLYAQNIHSLNRRNISQNKGWISVSAFPSMELFFVTKSQVGQLPVYELIDDKGKLINQLEDNKKLKRVMEDYEWGDFSFQTFKAADQKTDLNAWVILPPHFSKDKKYPVLMYQYSGPGSQEVRNAFPLGNYWWHQYMAQEGYIIVCVDGRGTGARGEQFKKSTYLQLGKYESDDQIAVAQQLQKLPYVDANRIGIWGWSYGGFMSATCLFKGHDVFITAVSVAPVTNWRLYDNIYTERFMRTPQENPNGYDENSPIEMAKQLKGNLLLIHGTSDDNVHFQNSVLLVDELVKQGLQFESAYYPNKDHGIYGGKTRYQLFTKITNYLKTNL